MFRKKNSMAETVGRIVDMTPDWIRYEMGGNGPIQAVPFFVSSHNAGDMYPVYEYTAGGRTYRKSDVTHSPALFCYGYHGICCRIAIDLTANLQTQFFKLKYSMAVCNFQASEEK